MREFGGYLDTLGIPAPKLDQPAIRQFDFLEGLLPVTETPTVLPYVQLQSHRYVDIHLFRIGSSSWVLLLDRTAEATWQQSIQQHKHSLPALPTAARGAAGSERETGLLWAVLTKYDMAVLECSLNNELQWIGPVPYWASTVFADAGIGESIELEEHSFLGSFLPDARQIWAQDGIETKNSGLWIQVYQSRPCCIQATAMKLGSANILLLRIINQDTADRTASLREARHRELAYEMAEHSLNRQIEELRQANRSLAEVAARDALTGIYNRAGFLTRAASRIAQASNDGERLLLFVLDMDNLKPINDMYGHEAGDLALQRTAQALQTVFQRSAIVARLGGDEFAVLVPCVSSFQRSLHLKRIDTVLAEINARSDGGFPLSLSVGTSWFDAQSPKSIKSLLSVADARMYEAKRAGKRGSSDGPIDSQ